MVTPAQNLANLGSAANVTAHGLGLDAVPVAEWSQADRISYLQSLIGTIHRYADQFSAETLAQAAIIGGQNFGGMNLDDFINAAPDGSASLAKIFIDSLGSNVIGMASTPAAIGAGVLNVVNKVASVAGDLAEAAEKLARAANVATSSTSWLLPLAVVAVVALLVLNTGERYERKIRGAFA